MEQFLVEIKLGKSAIGYLIAPEWEEKAVENERRVAKRVLEFLGFSGMDEYISMFPGTYKPSSAQFVTWLGTFPAAEYSKERNFFNMALSVKYITFPWYGEKTEINVVNTLKDSVGGCCGDAFTLPMHVKDVKTAYGMKSVPKKRLWFCEDWEG